jgi:hypothetical protein
VTLFEVIPPPALLDMMKQLGESGGRVVWCGPPPVLDHNGSSCIDKWNALFGVNYTPSWFPGQIAPGKQVTFMNRFSKVPSQVILTDFLVDHVYPVTLNPGTEQEAEVNGLTVGSRKSAGKGGMYYFGFRPRDDQSASLGYETGTLFGILAAAGAYPSTEKIRDVNDNTEYVSRTSDYLATRFLNGATIIARHYRTHRENWLDGFSRNDSLDAIALKENPIPTDEIRLDDFKVNGHRVSYAGRLITAFNTDASGQLVSFEGHKCRQITVDGKNFVFSADDQPVIAFTPATPAEKTAMNAVVKVFVNGKGKISIPLPGGLIKIKNVYAIEGNKKKTDIPFIIKDGMVTLNFSKGTSGNWYFICI